MVNQIHTERPRPRCYLDQPGINSEVRKHAECVQLSCETWDHIGTDPYIHLHVCGTLRKISIYVHGVAYYLRIRTDQQTRDPVKSWRYSCSGIPAEATLNRQGGPPNCRRPRFTVTLLLLPIVLLSTWPLRTDTNQHVRVRVRERRREHDSSHYRH